MAAITLQRGITIILLTLEAIRLANARKIMKKLRKAVLTLQVPMRKVIAAYQLKKLCRGTLTLQNSK